MEKKEKVYLFKVTLKNPRKKIYRVMAVEGTDSLEEFAKTIVNAFDFQLDHAFGFFNNLKDMYESSEAYTLFCDEGGKIMPNERSVKNSHINEVFELNKKMLFYFDYGDSWEFLVECSNIIEAETGITYPKVIKKQGEAPPQYVYPSDDSDFDYEDDCDDEQ